MKSSASSPKVITSYDPPSSEYYSAIYEFLQGHKPMIHWHIGNLNDIQEEDFMWAVISVSAIPDIPRVCPKPTVIESKYKSYNYIAFYCTVPDIEARGFSRTLCIVVANQISMLIREILHHTNYFIDFLINMQQTALNIFKSEIVHRMEVLHYLHRTYKEQSPQIITIMNEISPIFDSLNTGSTVSEDKTFEGITPEQITTIDNNLRDLEQITDLKAHEQELEDHIHSLFQSDVSSSAISYGKEHTLDPFLTFGTLGTFPIVLNKEKEFNECKFKMLDLRESGIFHHILYSILSGRTLVIESSFIKEAEALGNRFSLLVPFFKPEHFKVTESPISLESCLPYSVVITTKFNIDLEESDRVAYLNLNKHYYRGPICSQRSLVYKTLNINEVKTEFGLVLVSLNALETFKEKIIGISNLVENVPTSLSKVSQYWDMPSSYEGDFKIFEFWVHSANNRNSGRTVLMNHKLRAGTGIVVFYPKQ